MEVTTDSGTLQAFYLATYTADVTLDGSFTTVLHNAPVSRHLSAGLLTAGARVAVLALDVNNPGDCWIVGVLAPSSSPNTVACRVFRSSAQSVPNASQQPIAFDTRDWEFSNHSPAMWVAGDPTHLTLYNPGLYLAFANVEFAANNTGERTAAIINTTPNQLIGVTELPAVQGDSTDVIVASGPFLVTAQTSLQLLVYQTSGAALNVNSTRDYTPYLSVCQIG